MKKNLKKLSAIFTMALCFTLLAGCSKKKEAQVTQKDMIEKYAKFCTLEEYKGVEYDLTKTEVTDDMMQSEINGILSNYASSEESATEPAATGDKVNVDFVGTVDGEEFEGGSTNGAGYDITLGAGRMIPGFEDQIIGHKSGENFDIYVTFPENYGKENLNGKDAVFNITLNKVYKQTLPEYNDEFVADNTGYENTAQLEDAIKEKYTQSDENLNRESIMNSIMDSAVVDEYPEKDMQALIDETVEKVEAEAKGYGYDLETYVKAMYGVGSVDEFRQYISALAEDFMKEKIIICYVAKAEGITASEDDVKAYKQLMLDTLGMTEEELDDIYTEEDYIYYALADKVYDYLLENGTPVDNQASDDTKAE